MVKAVYDAVKATKPKALFGISPSGQYANTLALYANPVTWINSGTIDYLAPQIYWQIGHSTADFTTLANFWNTKSANNIPIFPGLAAYRLGESGFPSSTEFQNEVNVCRGLSNVKATVGSEPNILLIPTLQVFLIHLISFLSKLYILD